MEQTGEAPDVALMARVRTGDAAAFEVLHGRYRDPVRNFFFALSRSPATANDLAQETFLRVWKLRKRYRATGPFPAYLFAIARMIWHEACRAEGKQRRLGIAQSYDVALGCADNAPHPDSMAANAELRDAIHDALAELPEEQRIVFVLRTIEGLSLSDIADALDCPINTVRSRKILAVRKLRHLLAQWFVPAAASADRSHTP